MDLRLAGKAVLVTGGGGGIGSAVVRAFAAEGATVGIHYRTSAGPAEELAAETGGAALAADLRDEAEVDRLFAEFTERVGPPEVVVANAGVWPKDDVPVAELSLDRWRETLDSNLTATFLTARSWARHVAKAGRGNLVMVASTAGLFGEAGHADYAAAKAAISGGLLLSLKNEVVRTAPGARVNVVAPGWTVTPMTEGRLDPADVARVTATMSLPKVGRADDVAAAVLFLASEVTAGHLTGQVITVAGGHL
jgi:3-oxoacyl-[acyl-carrier protein] reductase